MRTLRSTPQWLRLVAPSVATGHVVREVGGGGDACGASDARIGWLSTVRAEAITNLLDNAAHHAPGSPVRITALQESGHVVVRVRDAGRRVPDGQEAAVFDRGVRDRWSWGSGLALPIGRDLLAVDGGGISISPSTPESPGCTVVMRLPSPVTPDAREWQHSGVCGATS
jgi:signal transduction histidine kinase